MASAAGVTIADRLVMADWVRSGGCRHLVRTRTGLEVALWAIAEPARPKAYLTVPASDVLVPLTEERVSELGLARDVEIGRATSATAPMDTGW
jgi:hypothetical protein